MATKQKNLPIDILKLRAIRKWLPDQHELDDPDFCKRYLEPGLLEISTMVELAMANKYDTTVVSEDTHDLANFMDPKCAVVREHNYKKSYGANISNVTGKIGTICAIVVERITEWAYLFEIPNEVYKHIQKTSNIEIPFNKDGSPKDTNHWWKYCKENWTIPK